MILNPNPNPRFGFRFNPNFQFYCFLLLNLTYGLMAKQITAYFNNHLIYDFKPPTPGWSSLSIPIRTPGWNSGSTPTPNSFVFTAIITFDIWFDDKTNRAGNLNIISHMISNPNPNTKLEFNFNSYPISRLEFRYNPNFNSRLRSGSTPTFNSIVTILAIAFDTWFDDKTLPQSQVSVQVQLPTPTPDGRNPTLGSHSNSILPHLILEFKLDSNSNSRLEFRFNMLSSTWANSSMRQKNSLWVCKQKSNDKTRKNKGRLLWR